MPDSTNELTAIASELREEAHRLRGIRYRDVTGYIASKAGCGPAVKDVLEYVRAHRSGLLHEPPASTTAERIRQEVARG